MPQKLSVNILQTNNFILYNKRTIHTSREEVAFFKPKTDVTNVKNIFLLSSQIVKKT